jgi:hypothetical protein
VQVGPLLDGCSRRSAAQRRQLLQLAMAALSGLHKGVPFELESDQEKLNLKFSMLTDTVRHRCSHVL